LNEISIHHVSMCVANRQQLSERLTKVQGEHSKTVPCTEECSSVSSH